jgi:SecD/SecF fusion protein
MDFGMNGTWMDGFWLLAQNAAAGAKSGLSWQLVVIAAVVFILPFVLGAFLARGLRLKDSGFKIGLVLFSIFFSLAPFVYAQLTDKKEGWRGAVNMGIDLAGGTNLVYQIDVEEAKREGKIDETSNAVDSTTLTKMVDAISRRINPSGAEEVTVRPVGNDRIEVIIPGADQDVVRQKKKQITTLGSLEFAILANERDNPTIIAQARQLPDTQDELRQEGEVVASWRAVDPKEQAGMDARGGVATREVTRRNDEGEEVPVRQFLVVHDPPDQKVTGRYLLRAGSSIGDKGLAVNFTLNSRGSILFSKLTTKNQPSPDGFERRLAILLNGMIHSAPNINERIPSGNVQITGSFSQKDVDALIAVLNAGALEVPLVEDPISEFTISPLLGIDVQQKGITAIIVSAVLVFGFMLVYYRTAGLIADLCLLLNLILVIGSMAYIEAAFTLPGLAGLVLTIGMAVDSNVLIYERMREELKRGASLRMAIQNGFDKALSAIVDGNVTTLITAVILYVIGSDQIRGFAVTLFIGLVMSMFSVLYFGHLCFVIGERKGWIKKLSMMQFVGETKIDFLGWRVPAFALSGAFILAGMASLYARGRDNLDIDFTGGTMVTFEFVEPQQTEFVQQRLNEAFDGNVSLEQLQLTTDTPDTVDRRFRIRTTEASQAKVREQLNVAFSEPGHQLRKVTMEYGPLQPVPEKLGDAVAEKIDPQRYAGGEMFHLTFSGGIAEGTAADYLAQQLERIPGAAQDQKKYPSAHTLIAVAGTQTVNADAEGSAARYTEMEGFAAKDVEPSDLATALAQMQERMAAEPVYDEINSFDTSVGDETQRRAFWAVIASLVMIVIYMWYRFERLEFGLAAVAALAHDVLVTLGSIALGAYLSNNVVGRILLLEDFKVNMGLIASLLTIVGYSLNDTIVIFDRIREVKGKNPRITYEMINLCVNQTLSRTILTALTVLIVVVVLYIFGGAGIHVFAYSMIIGTVTGCYSTIYIANPVLLWLVTRHEKGPAMKPVPA